MAKKPGPKESQLRSLREKSGGDKLDKADIKAKLAEARRRAEDEILAPYLLRLEEARLRLMETQVEVDELETLVEELRGGGGLRSTTSNGGGKRPRRNREELEAEAKSIVEYIISKGKEGVPSSYLRQRFPGIQGGVSAFVHKYARVKLRSEGERAATVYFAS